MFQEAERAFRFMQINREREEEVRQEMEAIKTKYESAIREIQDKLEEEKAKLKVRDLLLMKKDSILLRNLQTERKRDTGDTEQIINQPSSQAPSDRIKNEEEQLSKQWETAQGATGGESDRDKKKRKKVGRFGSFLKTRGQRKLYQKGMEDYDENETEIQEQNREETIHAVTNQKLRKQILTKPEDQTDIKNEGQNMHLPENSEDDRNLNKNKLMHEQYKEIEECKKKMEEIKKRYKEIEEIHATELKKMKKRHADNITAWNNTHGNCVLQ
ncbi:GTPase IMAP family member 8-like protein [Labeo rohita]|uniref:GTPase IMAP family member 8-like protein n=1 Tax=Labeo rohita TaxID=84645 RepID=A0A498P3H4_LABRO|nr:GTPase IMAP family member 8-like protein [Labeo rohita]